MYLSAQTSPEWTSGNAKKWMKSAVWSNGWTVSPHKSVNAVEFACQYHKNKDVWDAAFRFLAEHDLEALSIGNHVILEGKCWATVSEYIPKEVEKGNIESHLRFVDLQYVLWGNEKMGLASDVEVRQAYNSKKDVAFNKFPLSPDRRLVNVRREKQEETAGIGRVVFYPGRGIKSNIFF